MKRHHFEEDGVFDWSSYGVNVLTPRRQFGQLETEEETGSKKSRTKLVRLGGNSSNNNNNNNNDLQVPFIPVLHQVIWFDFLFALLYNLHPVDAWTNLVQDYTQTLI
jgi:hypothetical protein